MRPFGLFELAVHCGGVGVSDPLEEEDERIDGSVRYEEASRQPHLSPDEEKRSTGPDAREVPQERFVEAPELLYLYSAHAQLVQEPREDARVCGVEAKR